MDADDEDRVEFPLADFIENVASQLREAQRRHRESGSDTLLELSQCTLELAVTWDRSADGGIDLKVIKLGGRLDKTNTQTITVTMQPPLVITPDTLGSGEQGTPLWRERIGLGYLYGPSGGSDPRTSE